MNDNRLNRTSLRRAEKHREILKVAADLMGIHGTSNVSLEDVAKQADVARKTIYNHFENKEALILEMVIPICDHAKNYLAEVRSIGDLTLNHIWTYCLELWRDPSLYAILLSRVSPEDLTQIDEYESGFIFVFLELLKLIPELSSVSASQLNIMAKIIYQTYIPMLQCLSELENYEALFRSSMSGLIKGLL